MYTFTDRAGAASPSGRRTRGGRAFVENKVYAQSQPTSGYIGPMFRYERLQTGRMRQFHQFGVRCSARGSGLDAELSPWGGLL